MSDIQAQIDFLNDIKDVTEEFNAAYETRFEDPQRWDAAKHAYQERRTFWRMVNRSANLPVGDDTTQPSSVEVAAEIKGEVK
jgi:hypothetical protein